MWADVLDELDWSGRVINADLPGHGLAPAQDDYTMGALAASVAGSCDNDEEVIAVGHSLGGVVALCLASGFFRPVVKAAVGVGMKLRWTDDDVTMMGRVAAKGVRWFDTRDEAVDRFLLQAGLKGLADQDHPAVETGVTVGRYVCSERQGLYDGLINLGCFNCQPAMNSQAIIRPLAGDARVPYVAIDCEGPWLSANQTDALETVAVQATRVRGEKNRVATHEALGTT